MAKKKWRGVTQNKCFFQGEIIEDPQFNNGYGFAKLETIILERDANGQFIEKPVIVQLMCEPESNGVRTLQNHVQAGRKLLAECRYYPFTDGNGQMHHMFVVTSFGLGDKPFEPNTGGESNAPPLPG